jgi:tetratricopeptide (TPR) repeat protein
MNDYDRAIVDYSEAIRLDPGFRSAYLNRGNVYYNKKDNDRAITDYTEVIRLDPRYTNAYIIRGDAYRNKNDNDRAIADYSEAIRLDPRNADAYFNRGLSYNEKKDYDRAIEDYTEIIRLDPRNADAYNNRGHMYFNKNDYDRAITDFTEALRIDPNNSTAMNNLATAEAEKRNSLDRSRFTIIPSDFKPNDYTKVDLFKAVSNSRNLEISSNKQDALLQELKSLLNFGLGGKYYFEYVSDLTFVRQNGIDISFSSDDNAISQIMSIDQRSGLQAGQRVRVYYMITRSPLTRWDVIAIEWR